MKRLLISITFIFLANLALSQEGIVIKSVFFGGGSWYIDQEQTIELSDFIKDFPNIDSYTITVISHTDNIGGKEYNQWLSEKRSTSVVQQLLLNHEIRDHPMKGEPVVITTLTEVDEIGHGERCLIRKKVDVNGPLTGFHLCHEFQIPISCVSFFRGWDLGMRTSSLSRYVGKIRIVG